MSFLSIYLGSLMPIFCVTSAYDISDFVRETYNNVTSVTSVTLPPPLSTQHEAPKTLSDGPISIDYHQMNGPQLSASTYEKLKREMKERKSMYNQARKEFDLKKEKDEKEFAKMDSIVKEREEAEEKLKEEKARLDGIKARVDKEEADLKAEEEKIARIKEEIKRKDKELQSEIVKFMELKKEVSGECVKAPEELKRFWGYRAHEDTVICCNKC